MIKVLKTGQGPAGPPGSGGGGGGGGGGTLTYTQSTPSSLWIVNHNLGFKPLVDVFNNNDEEVAVKVSHTSANQFRVISETPFLGYVLYK